MTFAEDGKMRLAVADAKVKWHLGGAGACPHGIVKITDDAIIAQFHPKGHHSRLLGDKADGR
jgi:hypothetical protein